jgi:hypothetical protein
MSAIAGRLTVASVILDMPTILVGDKWSSFRA